MSKWITVVVVAGLQRAALAQSCPVEITKITGMGSFSTAILAGSAAKPGALFTIAYRNRSDKPITTVRFGVGYQNSMHEVSDIDIVTTAEGKLAPGKTLKALGTNAHAVLGEKVKVGWVEKVLFSDGTYWTDDGSMSCGTLGIRI